MMIVLILMAGGIFLSLETGRLEYSRKDIVAFETYAQCLQELDSISERYSKKLKTDKTY